MLVNDLFLACDNWLTYTFVNIFDIDKGEVYSFVGNGCLFKYGSYHVEGFTVLPSSDTINLRVTRCHK